LPEKEQAYFDLLKQKIVTVMRQSYPGINPSIELWKGQEIVDFQEDLRIKVNANISEKWFYTHMKSSGKSLPRIDVLNLLARYAGFANWDDFIFRNQQTVDEISAPVSANRYFFIVPLLALAIMGVLFGLFKIFNTRDYRFTFVDADTHEPLTGKNIEVILLPEDESPVHTLVGEDGIMHLRTDKSKIRMVVNSPYYQSDTIVRIVKKLEKDEKIMLKPDDYALMIHYFSTMQVDDWEKRRRSLEAMIDDRAMIYQVIRDKEEVGMALYNKQEFIDRLTMPAGSLRNVEVLASHFKDGKIMILRFRINEPMQ
jgi:hypothetical protein